RRHDVGEYLGEHHVWRVLPSQPCRLDVVEIGLAEYGGADRARDDGREHGGDDDDHRPRRSASERRHDGDCEQDERDREERVDDAADRVVGDPLEVAGDEAQRRPDERCEKGRERCDEKYVSRPCENSREDVPAQSVCSEEVLSRRRRTNLGRLIEARVVRGDVLAEDRAENPEQNDRRADDEARALDQEAQSLAARGTRLGADSGLGDRSHSDASKRMRGFRSAEMTSPTRVTMTYVKPMSSTPAESTV